MQTSRPQLLISRGPCADQDELDSRCRLDRSIANILRTRCYRPRTVDLPERARFRRHGTTTRTKPCVQEPSCRVVATPKSQLPDAVKPRQKLRAPWLQHLLTDSFLLAYG